MPRSCQARARRGVNRNRHERAADGFGRRGARTVIEHAQVGSMVGVDDMDRFVEKTRVLLENAVPRSKLDSAARARWLLLFGLDASEARWRDLLSRLLPLATDSSPAAAGVEAT